MSAHQTCTACGHANPASRLICEACGAPLAMAPAGAANMRTQAIPSLDELLTEDRQAFHDRLRSGQLDPPAESPTQGLDYNQFAAQLAGDRHDDFDGNDFEDEDNAAPTEAIDFNKIAAQFPELAALRSTGPLNPAPADAPKPAPMPPTPMSAPAPAPAPAPSPAPSSPMDDLGVGATPPAAGRANRPAPAPAPPAKKKLSTGLIIAIVVAVLFLLCLVPGAILGGMFLTRSRLAAPNLSVEPPAEGESAAEGESSSEGEGKDEGDGEPEPEAPAPEEGQ